MKKRAMTLLEVAIALALTSVLIAGLLKQYHSSSLLRNKLSRVKERVFSYERFQQRASQIFGSVLSPLEPDEATCYTQELAQYQGIGLCVRYKSAPYADLGFQTTLSSLFYLNKKEKRLYLQTEGSTFSGRQEVLVDGVDQWFVQFYDCSAHAWKTEWPKEEMLLPPMIKISLDRSGEERMDFAFFLPQSQEIIVYTQ